MNQPRTPDPRREGRDTEPISQSGSPEGGHRGDAPTEGTHWASGDGVRRQERGDGGWSTAPPAASPAWPQGQPGAPGPADSAAGGPTPAHAYPPPGGNPAPGPYGGPPPPYGPRPGAEPQGPPWGGPPQGDPPAADAAQSGAASRRRGPARRFAELLVVALIAAALTAGGLLALQRGSSTSPAAIDTAPRTVTQPNPSVPDWAATASAVGPSVVSIQVTSRMESGQGSGVIYDAQGRVVTNNHVVAGASGGRITVVLADKRVYTAAVVGTDPATDLAVLRLENAPADLRPIAMGDDTKLKVGDPVMAVGNPLGLSGTVTTGIASALNRPVRTGAVGGRGGEQVVTNAIQTSAAINPGNSGGALVNASGELVGINSSIASLAQDSSSAGNIGIGFAIPSNEVRNVADQLIATGSAQHAYLGVGPVVGSSVVQDGAEQRMAAKIDTVQQGTPAADAGLRPGDAVVAVDGEAVDSGLSLTAQIRERTVGSQVTLTVVRDGKRDEIRVTLGQRPSN